MKSSSPMLYPYFIIYNTAQSIILYFIFLLLAIALPNPYIPPTYSPIEYGTADSYTVITEEELEPNIRDIPRLTPYSGETYIRGALQSRNIYIPRWRVREALQTLDPINRAIRRRYAIQRRLYNVRKPNHLAYLL